MGMDAATSDPEGRVVTLSEARWVHIVGAHPELAHAMRDVVATIHRPDHRELDPHPGRERFFRRGLGPSRWLRVVVEYEEDNGTVITAFGQSRDPY